MVNHYLISGALSLFLYVVYYTNKDSQKLYYLLTALLIINFLTFNSYLLLTGTFDSQVHLPLHLCYLTELGILISIIFKNQSYYPILLLNSVGGGVTGFLNSNLEVDDMLIEHIHLYLSHFNLLLFSVILFKNQFFISKYNLFKSIILNALIFILVVVINNVFNSNYWFTRSKPPGINLTSILPDWPYYLFTLISIGLISYYVTFKIFFQNKKS